MSYSDDPVYGGLRDLRSELRLRDLLARAWEDWCGSAPEDIRAEWLQSDYQPFVRGWARVRAHVTPASGEAVKLELALHLFALSELADTVAESGRQLSILPCDGPPMFVRQDLNLVGWTLPNGPDLRALSHVLKPDSLSMLLEDCLGDCPDPAQYLESNLHRYMPSERAVVRWRHRAGGSSLYARLGDDERSMAAFSNAAKVSKACLDGELGIRGPVPITFHQGLQTMVASWVEGTTLTEQMTGATAMDAFRGAGRALAGLHRSTVAPSSFWSADQDCVELTHQLDGVGHALPDLRGRLTQIANALAGRCEQQEPSAAVPIHGGPTCGGILYDDGMIGFTRWDTLALGDPLHDAGRMVAHVAYLSGRGMITPDRAFTCIDAFRRGYRQASGEAFDVERLSWHMAASLLLIGKHHSLRRLAEGWEDHIRFVVDEADRVLAGHSAFLRAAARKPVGIGGRAA